MRYVCNVLLLYVCHPNAWIRNVLAMFSLGHVQLTHHLWVSHMSEILRHPLKLITNCMLSSLVDSCHAMSINITSQSFVNISTPSTSFYVVILSVFPIVAHFFQFPIYHTVSQNILPNVIFTAVWYIYELIALPFTLMLDEWWCNRWFLLWMNHLQWNCICGLNIQQYLVFVCWISGSCCVNHLMKTFSLSIAKSQIAHIGSHVDRMSITLVKLMSFFRSRLYFISKYRFISYRSCFVQWWLAKWCFFHSHILW